MNIELTSNLREDSKTVLFSIDLENYKHRISIYLDDLTNQDIFLYVYEYKYIYNGRTHVFENRTATALTNALNQDFDRAYNISSYNDLMTYFKSKFSNDEFAYHKIVNDIKSTGIGIDEDIEEREEDNYESLKRYF